METLPETGTGEGSTIITVWADKGVGETDKGVGHWLENGLMCFFR